MTPEEISERFIGTHPSTHGQYKTWDELRSAHETEIEKYAKSQNAAIQKHNESLISTITRNQETIEKFKEKEIRGDRLISKLYHERTVLESDLVKAKELLKSSQFSTSSPLFDEIEKFCYSEQTKKTEEKCKYKFCQKDDFGGCSCKEKVENQPEESKEVSIEALAKQMNEPNYDLIPAWSEDEYILVSNIWKVFKQNKGTNGKKIALDEIRKFISKPI